MRIGRLNKQVTIQHSKIARTGSGEETETWADEDIVWASIEPLRGDEYFSARQAQAEITHRIVMWFRKGLTPSNRLKYGNRIFDIESVMNLNERNVELHIMAKEKVI